MAETNALTSFERSLIPLVIFVEFRPSETTSVNQALVAGNTGSLFLGQLSMKVSFGISHRGKSSPVSRSMQ